MRFDFCGKENKTGKAIFIFQADTQFIFCSFMYKIILMRISFLIIAFFVPVFLAAQNAKKIHFRSILVDTHNDVLSSSVLDGKDISQRLNTGHSDLIRWKEGGLDVQFFSVWTGDRARNPEGFYKDANQEIDSLDFLILRNTDRMIPGRNYRDVKKGVRQKNWLLSLVWRVDT